MKKGIDKGIEIVIVLVVLIILAVAVVTFFTSNIKKGQDSSSSTIGQSDNSIKFTLCKAKCDECTRIYGSTGCGSKWATFQGNSGAADSCPAVFGSCPQA